MGGVVGTISDVASATFSGIACVSDFFKDDKPPIVENHVNVPVNVPPTKLEYKFRPDYAYYDIVPPPGCPPGVFKNYDGFSGVVNEVMSPPGRSQEDAFNDLYGLADVVDEVMKHRWAVGAENKLPRNERKVPFLIFSGPPGAGKTDVAVRTAQAWSVPLLVVEAAHVWGNHSERPTARLQQLGQKIESIKSCVVLFDEIDHFIASDRRDGESLSIRSQFRQLVDGPNQRLRSCNVLFIGTTNQLHRIERDMMSRAEVIHFSYPKKQDMTKIVMVGAPHLDESFAQELAALAIRYNFGPRDIHESSRLVHLRAVYKGEQEKPSFSMYRRQYEQRHKDYGQLQCEHSAAQIVAIVSSLVLIVAILSRLVLMVAAKDTKHSLSRMPVVAGRNSWSTWISRWWTLPGPVLELLNGRQYEQRHKDYGQLQCEHSVAQIVAIVSILVLIVAILSSLVLMVAAKDTKHSLSRMPVAAGRNSWSTWISRWWTLPGPVLELLNGRQYEQRHKDYGQHVQSSPR